MRNKTLVKIDPKKLKRVAGQLGTAVVGGMAYQLGIKMVDGALDGMKKLVTRAKKEKKDPPSP